MVRDFCTCLMGNTLVISCRSFANLATTLYPVTQLGDQEIVCMSSNVNEYN